MPVTTLQLFNTLLILFWTVSGALARWSSLPITAVVFSFLTYLVVFIFAGTGLAYFIFYRQAALVSDPPLLISCGLVFSLFFTPLLIFLVDTQVSLSHPQALALIYIFLLLLPWFRPPLPFLSSAAPPSLLTLLRHPASLAFILVLTIQLISLNQYVHLPGLDSYTWLLTYETTLTNHLYDLSTGVNRVLFSTLVAIFHRLSATTLFSIFKYWFPLLSILPLFPLWLIARTVPRPSHQFLLLTTLLASPAIILDWQTTRHQLILLLFLYLALGLLFTARRYHLPYLFWLTLAASFIGILYHPLFLILIIFWLLSALRLHRQFINQHPIVTVTLAFVFLISAHWLKFTSLISNLIERFQGSLINFVTGQWNLNYPAQFISEGLPMGWPGLTGVLKFYGFYAGPLTLVLIASLWLGFFWSASTRRSLLAAMFSPFLLPFTALFFFLLFLAEVMPRFTGIAYLPDRAWLLVSVPPIAFLPLLFRRFTSSRPNLLLTSIFGLALIVSLTGALYVNHALAFSIPDYELAAAAWMKNNLPSNPRVYTSSSKNVLRYYARAQLLRLEPDLITTDNLADILSHLQRNRTKLTPGPAYIYYAITDPRNPFLERSYVSSFTQPRPVSSFPALSSNPDYFELIYHQPSQVYLWRIK